ncbi:MAG: hypothetical protein ACRC36_04460, partial [Lacrimispora sphenoides]
GLVCANPVNKECLTQTVAPLWADDGTLSGLDVTFNITNVDLLAKAVKELQAGQQALQEGQEIQDGAIEELAKMSGGEV